MMHNLKTGFNLKVLYMTKMSRNIIKWSGSNEGGEYICTEFSTCPKRQGIAHETTAPYSPESNGNAETLNCSHLDMAKTVLLWSEKSGKTLWSVAISTACYIRNRLVSKSYAQSGAPYEIIHKRRPNLEHTKLFGSSVYVHEPKHSRDEKLNSCVVKGRLVGF